MRSPVELTHALLRDRAREMLAYMRFLRLAVESDAQVVAAHSAQAHPLRKGLTHTLKANVYLLLYSSMEAVLVQLLDEMHEAIAQHCRGADELNAQLVLMVAQNFRARREDVTAGSIKPSLHKALFQAWVNDWRARTKAADKRAAGIAGSVDGRAIFRQLQRYGVLAADMKDPPPHLRHASLQRAKVHRNTLAHGEKSFAELGRGLAFEELRDDARAIFRNLAHIVQEVETYLVQQRYLAGANEA